MQFYLSNTEEGLFLQAGTQYWAIESDLDALIQDPELFEVLKAWTEQNPALNHIPAAKPLAPIGSQEVWAAGVTYFRSRTARMEESEASGGSDFYDRVYHADRPELFMKATPGRVVGPEELMYLRRDSEWMVPEPELTLVVSAAGTITGYTIGNDLSCRDIEGENPLYLPQAKTFDRCAALGPRILVTDVALPSETPIEVEIRRNDEVMVQDQTRLSEMKKRLQDLVDYLFRASSFPSGCFLMTGTGIVPSDSFTLQPGDLVSITIPPIGTLTNTMGYPG